MKDTFILTHYITFLVFCLLGLVFLYYIIKSAVREGVRQAHSEIIGLIEAERDVERAINEMDKATK